jgi:hypothetical protein
MTEPAEDLVTLDIDPGVSGIFAWRNVLIVIVSGLPGPTSLPRLVSATVAMHERCPAGGSCVYVIRRTAGRPDSTMRSGILRLEQQYKDWLGGVGVVIGGSGFWASMMRSVVTAMRVASSRAYDMRLFGSVDEMAEWLPTVQIARTGVSIEPMQLLAALQRADDVELAAHP